MQLAESLQQIGHSLTLVRHLLTAEEQDMRLLRQVPLLACLLLRDRMIESMRYAVVDMLDTHPRESFPGTVGNPLAAAHQRDIGPLQEFMLTLQESVGKTTSHERTTAALRLLTRSPIMAYAQEGPFVMKCPHQRFLLLHHPLQCGD